MPRPKTKLNAKDQAFLERLQQDYPEFRFCLNAKRFSYRYAEPVSNPTSSNTPAMISNAPATNSNIPTKSRKSKKPAKPTIFIGPPQPNFALQALHELGHALSKHKDYQTHIKRLKIELEAWKRAKTVLENYEKAAKNQQKSHQDPHPKFDQKSQTLSNILPEWDQDYVEGCLDTYRDWLHTKSKCKKCGLTRYQTSDGKYHCPYCDNFLN